MEPTHFLGLVLVVFTVLVHSRYIAQSVVYIYLASLGKGKRVPAWCGIVPICGLTSCGLV